MGSDLLYALLSLFLVFFGGLMSGLTLGFMSQDVVDLKVLERSGTERQQRYARRILPVVESPHFTLCTLLLCNAIALEALPIFLNQLMHEATAIALSVTVVLVFGEIIPQAACCRYGLIIGAYSAWLVKFLRIITSPISWPISKLLDWLIGKNRQDIFKRREFKAFVDLHSKIGGLESGLSEDEVNVISGALDMYSKLVENAMTPLDKVFMISSNTVLDEKVINEIVETGHSRIPVYSGTNKEDILGLILVKELVSVKPDDGVLAKDLRMRSLPCLPANLPMYDVLHLFKTGRSHMAVLTKPTTSRQANDPGPANETPWTSFDRITKGQPIGIVTIEDLIEELLQVEIIDETDRFMDNMQTSRVTTSIMNSRLPPHMKKWLQSFTPGLGRISSRRSQGGGGNGGGGDELQRPSLPLLPRQPQP